ncbi:hypothetical protein CQA01_09950 [Cyclobacterium qasimii]|uniref:Uncharacterized protein n=2 Tax=Cyclobacterium qasimii TaxID=1350429 RepID=A0A512C8D1_9BACT|nr:hypothetical protein CQA01_09950 [Cyclobacterium qasimii]
MVFEFKENLQLLSLILGLCLLKQFNIIVFQCQKEGSLLFDKVYYNLNTSHAFFSIAETPKMGVKSVDMNYFKSHFGEKAAIKGMCSVNPLPTFKEVG